MRGRCILVSFIHSHRVVSLHWTLSCLLFFVRIIITYTTLKIQPSEREPVAMSTGSFRKAWRLRPVCSMFSDS